MVGKTTIEAAVTRTSPVLTRQGIKRWIRRWTHADHAVTRISLKIRRALGVPQIFPVPGRKS